MDGVADAVLAAPPRLGAVRLVAVDGPSGSGKSTFARELTATLRDRGVRTELISTDDFATWDDPVSWWPRLAEVLDRIAADARPLPRMGLVDRRPRPGAEVRVAVPEVLVVEGASAGRASVRPRLSRLCWVEVPCPEERLRRAVARDGEASRPMLEAWQRFERGWFAVDQTKRHADDVILPADV